MFERLKYYILNNPVLSIIAGFLILMLLIPKQLKKLFGGKTRRTRRSKIKTVTRPRRVTKRRGAGGRSGYPAAGGGTIPFKYNKDGTVKKAWQVAGTVAAKQRMARLRRAK